MSSPGPPGAVGAPGEEFERLFDEHYVPLRRYLIRRVGEHTAEDLAAETFLTAYRERLRFDPASGTPRSWLFGIATNLLRHQVRHEVRGYRAVAHARLRPGAPPDAAGARQVDAEQSVRGLAAAPGLEVTDDVANLDGRFGTALGIDDPSGNRDEVIIDGWAGEFIGERQVAPDGTVGAFTAVTTRGADRLGVVPTG